MAASSAESSGLRGCENLRGGVSGHGEDYGVEVIGLKSAGRPSG